MAGKEAQFGVCRGSFNETHSTWIIFQSPSLSDQVGNPVETRDPFEFWLSLLSLS